MAEVKVAMAVMAAVGCSNVAAVNVAMWRW
jgi:hypothetical protein